MNGDRISDIWIDEPYDSQINDRLVWNEDSIISFWGKDSNNVERELVNIKGNGTVVIFHDGDDVLAAKAFYNALQIEGETLYQKINRLENTIKELTGWEA